MTLLYHKLHQTNSVGESYSPLFKLRYPISVVIGQKFSSPARADAAARLASQQIPGGPGYKPGLSAGVCSFKCD